MKLSPMLAVLAGLGAATAGGPLSAQTSVQAGVGGGLSVPIGATSQGLTTGWDLLALVEVIPRSGRVGLRADLGLHHLGFEGGGGNTQVLVATADAVVHLRPAATATVRPYLVGGIGAFRFKTNSDFVSPPSQTKVGVVLGGGVDFAGLGARLFVEARVHNAFVPSSDFRFLAVTTGLRFGTPAR